MNHLPLQSAESKDQTLSKNQRYLHENNKSLKVQSNESLIGAARSSEDDSNDSAFADNGKFTFPQCPFVSSGVPVPFIIIFSLLISFHHYFSI